MDPKEKRFPYPFCQPTTSCRRDNIRTILYVPEGDPWHKSIEKSVESQVRSVVTAVNIQISVETSCEAIFSAHEVIRNERGGIVPIIS